jgi:Cdc6-like AAA superfamily ATPase
MFDVGRPLCTIVGGKYSGKTVSISDTRGDEVENDDLIREFKQLKIPNSNNFQLVPSDKGRQIIYITGASGSGKTYFTRQFLEQYKKKHKNHDIYVIQFVERR